jgi:hypothetical protein
VFVHTLGPKWLEAMEAVAFALPHLCLDQQHSKLLLQPIRWSAHCNQQFQIKEEKKCSDDSLGL